MKWNLSNEADVQMKEVDQLWFLRAPLNGKAVLFLPPGSLTGNTASGTRPDGVYLSSQGASLLHTFRASGGKVIENLIFIEVHWVCSGHGEACTDRMACGNLDVPGRLGPGQDWKCKERGVPLVGRLAHWGCRGQVLSQGVRNKEESLWAGGLQAQILVGSASPFPLSPTPQGLLPGAEYLWNGFYFYTFLYYASWDVFIISVWSSVVFPQTLANLYLFSFNKLSLFLSKFAFLLIDFPTTYFWGGKVMSAHLSLIKVHPLNTVVTSGNLLRVYQSQFSHLQSGANNNNNNTYLI